MIYVNLIARKRAVLLNGEHPSARSHATLVQVDEASCGPSQQPGFGRHNANMDGSVCGGQACVPWLGSIIRMRVISRLREVHELIFVLPQADALAYILFSRHPTE